MTAAVVSDALSAVSGRIAAIQAQIQSIRSGGASGASATTNSAATGGATGSSAGGTATTSATAFATALDSAVQNTAVQNTATQNTAVPDAAAIGTDAAATSTDTSSAASTVTGDDVVADAKKYLGVPYVWGGTSTSGLDCSGLVQLTFKDLGIDLPRVSRDQAKAGTAVPSLADARPGDLVAFGSPVNHIAIYLGNNQILEAPQPGQHVHITEMTRTPTAIRRIVPAGDGSSAGTGSGTASTTTLGIPPGLLQTWDSSQLANVPRAVPLATLGLSTAATSAIAAPATATAATFIDAAVSPAAGTASGGLTADQLTAGGLSSAVAAYAGDFAAAESKFNLPQGLLAAVAQAESAGNADAVSPAGAQGLMQLMPSTAAGLGVTDPFDPQQSIDAAGKLLSQNLSTFGGSLTDALAAYNAGAGAVQKYGGVPPYTETQNYVRTITNTLARLS